MGIIESEVPIVALTKGPKNHFFGDYGRSCWCNQDRRVLALRTDLHDRAPGPEDTAEVGYVETDNPCHFIPVNVTRAWNWQRGSMQCWVDRDDGECIVHNTRIKDRFTGTIINLKDGSKTQLPDAVYDIDSQGRYALSLNFARIHELRPGYGYAGIPDEFSDVLMPTNDGIFRIDLKTHQRELLLSLKQIGCFQSSPQTHTVKHWVNDLTFAPNGEKFCFLHRCWMPDGNIMSRLMTADIDGDNLRILYDGAVSHFAWQNDRALIAWAGRRRLLETMRSRGSLSKYALKLAKPLYHALGEPKLLKSRLLKEAYFIIYDGPTEPSRIDCPKLFQDGHCSFDGKGEWFITDTYPDRKKRMALLLCHPQDSLVVQVAKVDSDRALKGEYRCDLHPRWNHTSTMVCFDSSHEGGRQMYIADLQPLLNRD
ncbi:MAG: hypothetical protein ACYSTL_04650 [Planctomycetota bacterium]